MELMIETLGTDAGLGGLPDRFASLRPVDLVHLARYTLGDRNQEREILELFRRQSPLSLNRLKEAESMTAWQDAASSLKKSAYCIGAWHVAQTAAIAESLDSESRGTRQGELVRTLKRQIDETNDFIRRLLIDA